MTAEPLKPCPFCNGNSRLWDDEENYFIACDRCGSCGATRESEAEAIAAWNRREPFDYDKLRGHLQLVVNLLERGGKTVASEACIRALAWVFNIISNGNKDFDFDPLRIGNEFGLICDKSSRVEPFGNSDEMPLWMKEIITEKLMPGSRPWNYETRVIMDTLEWVLSLKKPEKKP